MVECLPSVQGALGSKPRCDTQEAEAGESDVCGHPGLDSELQG